MSYRNWFPTLNDALDSEGLLAAWDCIGATGINYNETRTWTWDDGSRYGRLISVYRSETGLYERPVHYTR
jgi:hypothetical protein